MSNVPPAGSITPTLWVNGHDMHEVAAYYCGLFPDGQVLGTTGPTPDPVTIQVQLAGQVFVLLNGGEHRFEANESVSFALCLADQAEVDRVWAYLSAEGEPSACGWIKDRYGFSWQVVPQRLYELLDSDDPEAVGRVTECFMQVYGRKFDIAELEAAYAGR